MKEEAGGRQETTAFQTLCHPLARVSDHHTELRVCGPGATRPIGASMSQERGTVSPRVKVWLLGVWEPQAV